MNIKRRLLTDMMLAELRDALETGGADEVQVGDHEVPDGGGWPDEEGQGTFVNYVVLMTLAAGEGQGALGGRGTDAVVMPYALVVFAVSREGAEHTADRARAAITGLKRVDTADGLRVQYINTTGYGAVERIDAVEPPLYAITDSVAAFVSQS